MNLCTFNQLAKNSNRIIITLNREFNSKRKKENIVLADLRKNQVAKTFISELKIDASSKKDPGWMVAPEMYINFLDDKVFIFSIGILNKSWIRTSIWSGDYAIKNSEYFHRWLIRNGINTEFNSTKGYKDKINMQLESTTNNNLIQIVEPREVTRRMSAGDSFVVNIVAAWCPDCTVRQKQHIERFAQEIKPLGLDVLQVNVQQQRGEFISLEHENMTNQFGGHGYPRTVLIEHGKIVDQDNVEVITKEALSALVIKFTKIIAK